jgi:hypothetical protein
MEAIAHSPSFAKKAGVPQSVGKDFATADKGKTFKHGGNMKGYADGGMPMVNKGGKMVPSFAADGVGKMAKGGMAAKMKMFEKSGKDIEKKGVKEGSKADMALDKKQMMGMKQGGKVRRMAGGGMGDPFERDTDYEAEKAQGAKNLEGIKGFFGFGKNKDEEAPIERSRDMDRSRSKPEVRPAMGGATTSRVSSDEGIRTSSGPQRKISSDEPQKPTFSGMGEFEDNYESQRGNKVGSGASGFPSGYKDSGFSAMENKPSVPRIPKTSTPSKPIGVETTEKKQRVITEPSDSSYSSLEERRAARKPKETESKRKFGMASDETREAVRKGLGSALDFFNLSKRHEQEFGKKLAKGGDVKKMAQGGYAKADGIASRGKTQPKMVKMAGGGFVKSADGCAQRGKTKAFQVKMNRGGKC